MSLPFLWPITEEDKGFRESKNFESRITNIDSTFYYPSREHSNGTKALKARLDLTKLPGPSPYCKSEEVELRREKAACSRPRQREDEDTRPSHSKFRGCQPHSKVIMDLRQTILSKDSLFTMRAEEEEDTEKEEPGKWRMEGGRKRRLVHKNGQTNLSLWRHC